MLTLMKVFYVFLQILKKYHNKWYQPDNISLYIVGESGYTNDEILAEVEKAFGEYSPTRAQITEEQRKHLEEV